MSKTADPIAPTEQNLAPSDLEQDQNDRFDQFFKDNGGSDDPDDPDNLHIEPEPNVEPEPEPEPEPDPNVEPEPEPEPEPNSDPDPDPNVDPDPEPNADPNPADLKIKLDKNDEFDAETFAEIVAMSNDPHAGIRYVKPRGELKIERQKNAALEAGGANTPEMQEMRLKADRVETIEAELAEAQDRLALVDYQGTKEYQSEITQPYEDIKSRAASIEAANDLPAGSILNAISSSDESVQTKNLEALYENHELDRRSGARLFNLADDLLKLQSREHNLRETAQQRLADAREMDVSQQAVAEESRKAEFRSELTKTFSRYEGKLGAFVNSDGTNTDEWTDAIKNSEDIDFRDPEIQAVSAYALTTAPVLVQENKALAAEVSKYKTLLARSNKAAPPSPDASPAPKRDTKGRFDPNKSMADALGAKIEAAGLGS